MDNIIQAILIISVIAYFAREDEIRTIEAAQKKRQELKDLCRRK